MNAEVGSECLVVGGPRKGEVLLKVRDQGSNSFQLFSRDGKIKLNEPLNVVFFGKHHIRDGEEYLILSEESVDGIDINAEMDKLAVPLRPLKYPEKIFDDMR